MKVSIVFFTLTAFLLLLPGKLRAHPLHVSITNITFENGKLMVTLKTFRDDWQTAYFHYHGKFADLTPERLYRESWFRGYLDEKFVIARDRNTQHFPMDIDSVYMADDPFGAEVEAMTIEMHATVTGEPNSLYIYNAILTDIFPDQSNLVILGFRQRESGIKFDIRKQDAVVKLK